MQLAQGQEIVIQPPVEIADKRSYSVEFFHIYTDEEISPVQTRSLEFLLAAKDAWNLDSSTVILIDNYNPTNHILTSEDVFDFLETKGCRPDYWAYEGDLVANAENLLASLTDGHLERSYRSYIGRKGKYPCSLLTATWYLTRLGVFSPEGVMTKCVAVEDFKPAQYLINILPEVYKPIEKRAHELIESSSYASSSNYIQALYYPVEMSRNLDLF